MTKHIDPYANHDPDYADFDDPLDGACERCDGTGVIVVCCDDLCQAQGECIHGDGEIVCPNCHGEG